MQLPLPVVTPLSAALVYAFAALTLKRATEGGTGPWRVSFVVNWVTALSFAPVYFFGAAPFSWVHVGHAMLNGGCFFVGQIFTFLALSRGDVSVATPVLGTKVIFVAGLTVLVTRQPIPAVWWGAALITAVATALLGGGSGPVRPGQASFQRSLFYGFAAAFCFSLTDVLSQQWAPAWGFRQYAPAMFLTVGLCSLGLIPFFRGSLFALSGETWRWLGIGAVLLSVQAGCVAVSIISFGQATQVNILYASRGLWTVLLVWLIGHWFGNEERGHGHRVMVRRFIGAALLLTAVVLVAHRPK